LSTVLVLALAGGCTGPAEPPLRVGTNVWPGYETLYLARHLGLIDEIDVRLVELPSATEVMRAMRAGLLDGATLTLDETLSLVAAGLDLDIVAVMDFSDGGDALVARVGIDGLSDLAGRRIGVERTAVGALMLDAVLERAGLTPDDVRQVYLSVDEHEAAYRNGDVDAVVTFEPVLSRLVDIGAVPLFDSAEVPGRIVDVLVFRDGIVASRADDVRAVVAGHFAALSRLEADPEGLMPVMSQRTELPPPDFADALDGLAFPSAETSCELIDAAGRLAANIEAVAETMRRAALLPDAMATHGLLEAGCLWGYP